MLWMNKNVPAIKITVVHLFRWLCLECGDSVWIAFEKLRLLCIFHVFPLSIYLFCSLHRNDLRALSLHSNPGSLDESTRYVPGWCFLCITGSSEVRPLDSGFPQRQPSCVLPPTSVSVFFSVEKFTCRSFSFYSPSVSLAFCSGASCRFSPCDLISCFIKWLLVFRCDGEIYITRSSETAKARLDVVTLPN